jgi:hypothetical protein
MRQNAHNTNQSGRRLLSSLVVAGLLAAVVGLATPANAQATPAPPVDYAALATTAKTETTTALGAAAPVAFAIMAIVGGVYLVMRMAKRGMKSS